MTRPAGTKNAVRGNRVDLHTTVAPETAKVIEAERKPGETTGQVLDRWAVEALKGEKI